MLNKSGINKSTYGTQTQILANVEMQSSVGCVVSKSAGVKEGDRTIVKAGTPVTGNLDALATAFTEATELTEKSNATGVILHDVDVTAGNANATLLIFGFVNKNRLDSVTKAKITEKVQAALSGKVTFLTV